MQLNSIIHVGLDVGSTTVKVVALDKDDNILFSKYSRHYSDVRNSIVSLIEEVCRHFPEKSMTITVTGSGGISVSNWLGIPFVQEVIAATAGIRRFIPKTDVAIELGGEDAKITFFDSGVDQRMNETCAGGTGAFIDQMAAVMQTDASGLNALAANHKTIYPIAARCGVFAKTDVMPLLNEGAAKEDIAASIFQAVVDQTVGGLACGRSIRGNIAFLGGPLYFLPQLRQRFIDTLEIKPENIIFPENAQFFVAIGTAFLSKTNDIIKSNVLFEKVEKLRNTPYDAEIAPLPPLFVNEEEKREFFERHKHTHAEYVEFKDLKGDIYLGIDAGSTTTKAVAIDSENRIAYSWYGSNHGTPLNSVVDILKDLYSKMPSNVKIKNAAATGYGEALLKEGLGVDEGEVETVVHYKAASFFVKDVSFILDIGGQDMKCLYVKNGVIDKIVLNEACSSGCGSFVENFANSLGMNIKDFAKEALDAKNPVDLGSRCTVFMNSKVKQAQKEGATVADISAGLSYSVIKNALYKVIKIARPEELGEYIVVQGGTFFNDAILRSMEMLVDVKVVRPNIAGLMGAFGAALLAKERAVDTRYSNIITDEKLKTFEVVAKNHRCKLCSNRCLITVNIFPEGNKFISGNRCEKGAGIVVNKNNLPNLYEFKHTRLFDYYAPLAADQAKHGEIGIPRALNTFENYPYWFTFFTQLGFRVILSDRSSRALYNTGLETIPSQTVCFPAKMVHGHIANLARKGLKRIFYPAVPYEKQEFSDVNNHYNCPVVANYPEVIRLNVDELKNNEIDYIEPYLTFESRAKMDEVMHNHLKHIGISKKEIKIATLAAEREQELFRNDIKQAGEEALAFIKAKQVPGIILAGRPYHIDPAIHHGIPELIISNGVCVLTEDSVSHLGDLKYKLNVIDQWVYHSRLYRAATVAAHTPNLELVQLNSFGCGLDAITTEQVEEILSMTGKSYTLLKIDEGSNLGAVRIRIRSLLATLKDRDALVVKASKQKPTRSPEFLPHMKDTHTILCPQLSPIHFKLLRESAIPSGYDIQVLPKASKADIEEGLRYVNNDACFPAITVVGQLINALKSGQYDPKKTALIISQTGGGCRATNYVAFLQSAAQKAGFPDVPVIPFNMGSMDSSGMTVSKGMIKRMMLAFLYGDLLLRVTNRTRPYELTPGAVESLANEWVERLKPSVISGSRSEFVANVKQIVKEFDTIPIHNVQKPKVGVVGEILIKFHPDANNQLISVIENEGGEAVVPDFMDFILYCVLDKNLRQDFLPSSFKERLSSSLLTYYIEWYRDVMRKALKKSKRFDSFGTTKHLASLVNGIVSLGNQTGEGWLLTAEMVELIEGGAPNIVLVQPFACLPNHITGKGVMKELKRKYSKANIVAVDYDPGASEVNQLNRIKLMMSVAKENHSGTTV